MENDAGFVYFLRLRHHDDEIGMILKAHLLAEYLLNRIIQDKLQSPNKIIDDHRSYTFSVKLQILYSARLLSERDFKNISSLNKIRNDLMHKLDVDLVSLSLLVFHSDKSAYPLKPPRKGVSMREPVRSFCWAILDQLNRYMREDLGMAFDLPLRN
jgi:hypothetical protein